MTRTLANYAAEAATVVYSDDICNDADPWATWVGEQTHAGWLGYCEQSMNPDREEAAYIEAVAYIMAAMFTAAGRAAVKSYFEKIEEATNHG